MINIIQTKEVDIFSQLRLEEFLLKAKTDSFCIISEGRKDAIVLGISNKSNELVHINNAKKDNIQVIRRFSGGGSVFVDKDTVFVTFIFSSDLLKIDLYPETIMKWSEGFYKKVFDSEDFKLIENDFVFKDKKIAGNAQYIKKNRFLLHTSFLFDFDIKKINKYLQVPKKAPAYRNKRNHEDFITKISPYISKNEFFENLYKTLKSSFNCQQIKEIEAPQLDINYSTQIISI
ncbi:MAG: lipoate--protein ligase family protein [Parachlamydiales bacterium]|jgi:lipoate-protein ligase A